MALASTKIITPTQINHIPFHSKNRQTLVLMTVKNYILTVLYLADYSENTFTRSSRWLKTRTSFCSGFPDNSRQLTLDTCKNFAHTLDSERIISSACHGISNGKAESGVKSAKSLLSKT